MNQVFNFQRFALLVAKHWAENKRRYVLSVLAFIGLLAIWFVLFMFFVARPFTEEMQKGTYIFCLYLGGAFYASQYFRDLGSRHRAIHYLMMPASLAEKTLCGLFYSVVVYFAVYTAAFYLVDTIAITLANTIHPYYNGSVHIKGEPARAVLTNIFAFDKPAGDEHSFTEPVFLFAVLIQTAFLLGSVYFSKYSFIKTVITLFLLFVFIIILGTFYQRYVLPGSYGSSITYYNVQTNNNIKQVRLPHWTGVLVWGLFTYALVSVLWLVTYFRLKEKEV